MKTLRVACIAAFALCGGCAGLHFNGSPANDALTYYEPVPFAVVKVAADCTTSVDVISLPGKKRSVAFHSGFGSANLSVKLSNGILTDVGQQTDTKIPETISAIAGLAKAVGPGLSAPGTTAVQTAGTTPKPACKVAAQLFAISSDDKGGITIADHPSLEYTAAVVQQGSGN